VYTEKNGIYKGTLYRIESENTIVIYTSIYRLEVLGDGQFVNTPLNNSKKIVYKSQVDPLIIKECEEKGFYSLNEPIHEHQLIDLM